MRRLIVAVALVAAAVTSLSIAVGSAKSPGGRTFKLIETNAGSTFHFVDEEPLVPRNATEQEFSPSPGDRFLITQPVNTPRGQRAGTIYAECTFLRGGRHALLHCTGTLGLKGGQLALDTRIKNLDGPAQIAITGGTGAYEGARGSILSVPRRNNTSVDTVHVLP